MARKRIHVVGPAILLWVSIVILLVGVPALAKDNPNSPDYWGDNCWKIDRGTGSDTWVADDDYSLVVLKAGTENFVFDDVHEGDVLVTGSGKDVSHLILCQEDPSSTTTTTTSTTPTTSSTTSTSSPSSTTSTSSTTTSTTTTVDPSTTTTTALPTTTTTIGSPPPTACCDPEPTTTTEVPPSTSTTTTATTTVPPTTTTSVVSSTLTVPPTTSITTTTTVDPTTTTATVTTPSGIPSGTGGVDTDAPAWLLGVMLATGLSLASAGAFGLARIRRRKVT